MAKMRKKSELPTKVCPTCQRPFSWRKKWERNWDSVVYCSKRCRSAGSIALDKGKKDQSNA